MTISVTNIGTAGTSGTSSTVVLSGVTVPAGAAILILASEISNSMLSSSVTDSAGNTYAQIYGPIYLNNNSTGGGVSAWLCQTASALSGGSITYHKSATIGAVLSAVYIAGMSGPVIDTGVSVHAAGNKSGQGTLYSITTGAPAGAGEPFFCATVMGPVGGFLNLDTGNGWSHPPNNIALSGADSLQGGAQINAGTGTKVSAPSESGFFASFNYAGFAIALMNGAAPVPPPDGWMPPASEPVGFGEREATQTEIAAFGTGVSWNAFTPPTIPVVTPLPSWEIAQPRLEEDFAADLAAQAAVISDASSGLIYTGRPDAGFPTVSQLVNEAPTTATPSARASQLAGQAAASGSPSARASQIADGAIAQDIPRGRASQLIDGAITQDIPRARASQFFIEIVSLPYYQPPAPDVYPTFPSLTFPVTTRATFLNTTSQHANGREVRASLGSLPIWQFTLDYSVLRGTLAFTEFAEMLGFFFAQVGTQRFFCFHHPYDNRVTDEAFVTTNGRSVFGPLQRTYANFTEPVGYVDLTQTFTLYQDGYQVDPADYFVLRDAPGNQEIKFRDTPSAGHVLTVDMSYFYICRFSAEYIDMQEFMRQLHTLAQVKLIAPRARRSMAGEWFGYVTN